MTDTHILVTQTTLRQNIEQERGKAAWKNVKDIKDLGNETLEKKYRSFARGLNAMIQVNGLGQTLGFLCAKSKSKKNEQGQLVWSEHYYLLSHLTAWMREHFTASNISAMSNDHKGLLSWIIDENTFSTDYRRATTECLAFGVWLSRFAEAELKSEEE